MEYSSGCVIFLKKDEHPDDGRKVSTNITRKERNMDNQEKSFPQLAQETNETSPTLDEELLEAVTGAGAGTKITNFIKSCIACGKPPSIEPDEEYMRSESGRHYLSITEGKDAWKQAHPSPEQKANPAWEVRGQDLYGKGVAVKYPWSPRPTTGQQ
jgi:hypothetical protein